MLRFSLLRLLPSAGFNNKKPPFKPYQGGAEKSSVLNGSVKLSSDKNEKSPLNKNGEPSGGQDFLSTDEEYFYKAPSPALMSFYKRHETAKSRSKNR